MADSAAFPYIKEAQKATKLQKQKILFQISTLNHHSINKLCIQLIYSVVLHFAIHQPIV